MRRRGKRRILLGLGIFLLVILVAGVVLHHQPENTRSWSWSIGTKVVVIDAGHGGPDPGAVGKTKILEKDVTLAVAKRVQAFIQQGGGKPIMVRSADIDLGTASGLLKRKREDLAQRIQIAADAQADVYLSIHANSFPNEKLVGPQTFYHTDSSEGRVLAQDLQQELNLVTGGKRVAKANKDFFILKQANQAAVTVELGFLSNATEEQLLNTPEYQQKLAWAIYQGLCNFFATTDKAKAQGHQK